MRQRLIPKPVQTRATTSLGKLSDKFRRNESTINAITALLSSVGLIIASTSTWIAWKQIEILSEDRTNPFKAVVFEQKVASMNDVLGSIATYQSATICLQTIPSSERIFGINADNRRKCVQHLDAPSQGLVLSAKRAFALWPSSTQKLLVEYMSAVFEQNQCASIVLLMYGQESKFDIQTPPNCDDDFRNDITRMNEIEFRLRREMVGELSKSTAS